MPVYNVFLFSDKGVIFLKILERILNFYGKSKKYMVLGIYTDPDRPDPDRQALDDDSDPTK